MSDTKHNDGGPAFPSEYDAEVPYPHNPKEFYWAKMKAPGMTLRDYFAAKAMQGLCSLHNMDGRWTGVGDDPRSLSSCASFSYKIADAMLKAREQ